MQAAGSGHPITLTVLVALLVCLIPTTIGALLSAIGIAGMDRMIRANVIATSGRAVEAAGDVDVLLLDKTGTITLGNRQAVAFHAGAGIDERVLAEAAQLASLADETPEGRSVVVLAQRANTACSERQLGRARGAVRAVHRADPHERRRPGRPAHPQGRARCGGETPGALRAASCRRRSSASPRRSPAAAPRR